MRSRLNRLTRAMSDSVYMKNNRKKPDAELAKGQVWKTGNAYVQIMDRGKRLISYKMMREREKRAVMTQMSGIAEVESFLKANNAELVEAAA
jgi:hypothetical protein